MSAFDADLLDPAEDLLEGAGEDGTGGGLGDAHGKAVDALRGSARGVARRLLERGQALVDALDGRIGPVDVHFDYEFELVIGHGLDRAALP